MATEVLEHLEDPRKGLKELIRVSKSIYYYRYQMSRFYGSKFPGGKNLKGGAMTSSIFNTGLADHSSHLLQGRNL